jgi:hypothetical protein
MTRGQKIALGIGGLLILGVAIALAIRARRPVKPGVQVVVVEGAVVRQDSDPRKQAPLEGALVSVNGGNSTGRTRSDASGHFKMELKPGVEAGERVSIRISHEDYDPFEITRQSNNELLIARLEPVLGRPSETPSHTEVTIKDVRVRYTVKVQNTVNVGSTARTFIVQNLGDVACDGQPPCSPDGKWKATTTSLSLDAGDGNEFSNARVSCIAGPCPFTRVGPVELSQMSRYLKVSSTAWSDTVTFLVEAEVTHEQNADMVRYSYPVIFGPAMNFTLPVAAEGPSIEAALNGTDIVFPLGPALILSWGDCSMEVSPDGTRLYRCELKPGYTF